jgi:hypothetical protein
VDAFSALCRLKESRKKDPGDAEITFFLP